MQFVIVGSFLLLAATLAAGQMGGMGGNKKKYTAEKRDLPYIACDACAGTVTNLYIQVSNARAEYGPKSPKGRRMPEERVSDILDGICSPKEEIGEWIRHIDIVSQPVDSQDKKRKLNLVPNESAGKCKKECETVAKSCTDLLENEMDDRDELQALLYVDKKWNKYQGEDGDTKLVDHVCKKMVGRCKSTKSYSTAKYEREDEEFAAVSEKDLEMEKLMAEMQGMPGMAGQGLNMYDRDDMEAMGDMMGGVGYGGYDGYGDDQYGGGIPGLGDEYGNPMGMGGAADMEL